MEGLRILPLEGKVNDSRTCEISILSGSILRGMEVLSDKLCTSKIFAPLFLSFLCNVVIVYLILFCAGMRYDILLL